MFGKILLIFIAVPFIEIYLLLTVGEQIGALSTIALIILTALIGTYLLRLQGFQTLSRVQTSLNQGQLPATAMFEGVMLIIAGALLLTPGFFTDAVGFLLLIPAFRQFVISRGVVHMAKKSEAHVYTQYQTGASSDEWPSEERRHRPNVIIDGDYENVDKNNKKD